MSDKNMKRKSSSGEGAEMAQKQKWQDAETPVTIAMSSELLFRTEQQSLGPAYPLVKALKAVNAKLKECYPESEELFKVLLIHDNSSDLSDRLKEHKLEELITPLSVSGKDLIDKLQEKETHLYLSADELKVQEVLNKGIAAAIMYTPEKTTEVSETQLRVVFDGDAVLFSDESEKVYKEMGLKCFMDHEKENVNKLMKEGPFKGFLEVLVKLQKKLYDKDLDQKKCPIRTYLLTSRNANSAGYRALNTLKTWGLETDEAYFLGVSPKGPLLKVIRPHIFFDDQMRHVDGALKEGIVACHVKYD